MMKKPRRMDACPRTSSVSLAGKGVGQGVCASFLAATARFAVLVAAAIGSTVLPLAAQEGPILTVSVGDPGTPSYRIGLGLASLLRTAEMPDGAKVRTEVWHSPPPDARVRNLLEDVEFAVVPGMEEALQDPLAQGKILALVGLADGNQVLAKSELDDDLVYMTTQLIFENLDFLRLLYQDIGDLELKASLERIEDSVHPGAMRYYRERGLAPPVASEAPEPSEAARADGKNFTVYFGFDDASLEPNQMSTVAEACRFAATLPSARFVLGGHADTVGPDPYNDSLSLARAKSVAAAIRNDPRFKDAWSVVSFGERELAVPTPDGVSEPKNRRVVITVLSEGLSP